MSWLPPLTWDMGSRFLALSLKRRLFRPHPREGGLDLLHRSVGLRSAPIKRELLEPRGPDDLQGRDAAVEDSEAVLGGSRHNLVCIARRRRWWVRRISRV